MAELPELLLPDAAAWRAWLVEHHETSPGVRLVLHKKGGGVTELTYAAALDEALCFGWIDGQSKRFDEDYTLQAFTPRRARSVWSQVNVENVARLIEAGRMRPSGHAEIERAQSDGRWDAAYRQKGAEAPADLVAALDAHPEAAAFFESATKVQRFQVFFRLAAIKSPTTRARRIAEIVEHAARGEHRYK